MARLNPVLDRQTERTHEGAPAYAVDAEAQLRRSVMACLLWESEFYESGQTIAERIAALVPAVAPDRVASLAIEARERMHLRHAPLLIVREMARHATHRPFVRKTLGAVIQRADELAEFLAIYWRGKRQPLAKSVQRGLADAFPKFNAYALAKYNRDGFVKLRDVLFLAHPKPKDADQAAVWKQLVDGALTAPDTWEVALSAGASKQETFERLLREQKLGGLAFLRNLRNMIEADVDASLVRARFAGPMDRVLPFRFLSAVRHAPMYAAELNDAMLRVTAELPRLQGRTAVLVDVSASMDARLSAKSEMVRMDAAAGLAVLLREISDCRVFSFSHNVVEVQAHRGLPLARAIVDSQPHGGTYLGEAVRLLTHEVQFDRLVVITDEQSHDRVPGPNGRGYMINVASAKHGVGYGPWTHIDGFSERVLDYMYEVEHA